MNQFFSPLAEPVGAVWSLMALGVIWLLCRRQWRSALWLGFPTVLLFVLGSTSVAERLVAAEEKQWVRGEKAESGKQKAEHGAWSMEVGGQRAEAQGVKRGQESMDESSVVRDQNSEVRTPVSSYQPSTINHQPTNDHQPSTNNPQLTTDAVVALGGGQRVSHDDLLGFAMEGGGSRVLTAIELVRSGKARTLVLGGSWPMPGNPTEPSMSVVQDWLTKWGLGGGAVTNLGICINTHDEAIAFKKLAQSQGWVSVMLVTSALHMRRSVAVFKKQGIAVTPVAADFHVQGVSQDLPFSPFPREHRFSLLTLYLHEKIGWWIYRARGWV